MNLLSERLSRIEERIAAAAERAGRSRESVRLLAVTKGVSPDLIREAIASGLSEFGESRVQEAEGKIAELGEGPRWHLVGHLQSNKARRAVQLFEEIHSLDSPHLIDELARRAGAANRSPRCYVEVNTSGEAAKQGVAPDGALALLRQLQAASPLRTAGLMTIGPREGGSEGARASFRTLARIRDEARDRGLLDARAELSMGMSDDFEIAVEEGATTVRVGSALFGVRTGAGRMPRT